MPALSHLLRRFLGLEGSRRAVALTQSLEPASSTYPGDWTGPVAPYGPLEDGIGPGEVVWAHVPFEEDHSQGKDRPALVVGHDSGWVLGLPMTSQDHDRDEDQERRAGRHWIDVGSGGWDRQRRRSEARVDRIVRLDPSTVRREGGQVDEGVYQAVVTAVDAVRRGEAYDDDPV